MRNAIAAFFLQLWQPVVQHYRRAYSGFRSPEGSSGAISFLRKSGTKSVLHASRETVRNLRVEAVSK
jgi:hypothetical protein